MERYQIIQCVGRGTEGEVFKAKDLETNEIIALKICKPNKGDEGVSFGALVQIKNLQITANCSKVLQLKRSFLKDAKDVVLVTPYYQSDLVAALPHLRHLGEVKCIFKQILEGVAQIHEKSLMHLDLKSSNIFLNNGDVVIGDLGMATNYKIAVERRPNKVVTLWYRSPELLLGATNYGKEVDMWSIGIIFIELMTKLSPFPGKNESDQIHRILSVMGNLEGWGLEKYPGYPLFKSSRNPSAPKLRHLFRNWSSSALDLLENFLCPADKRISAADALKHPFFGEEPLPHHPSRISFPDVHALQVKRKRAEEPRQEMADALTAPTTKKYSYVPSENSLSSSHKQHQQSQSTSYPYHHYPYQGQYQQQKYYQQYSSAIPPTNLNKPPLPSVNKSVPISTQNNFVPTQQQQTHLQAHRVQPPISTTKTTSSLV